jgi:ribose transport system ATP-binding protein
MNETILRIEHICKHFGATQANSNISIEIKRGMVHGLAGENGSGKSTLASIICGIQETDSGTMYKNEQVYAPRSPLEAHKQGVAMVVQEMGVIGNLSAAVNLFLGHLEQFSSHGIINTNKMQQAARVQFNKWDLPVVPFDLPVSALSIEQRKTLELARALAVNPDVLVLDEISQALSQDTRNILYKLIRKFTQEGKSVLLITHDLDEMMQFCDEISVLRDGELISTKPTAEMPMNELKRLMIGREFTESYYRSDKKAAYSNDVLLDVQSLTVPGKISNVTFQLHKGEILGVCGLSDGGIHELGRSLYCLEDKRTGTVTYKPTGTEINTQKELIAAGGAYLSKDRDYDGLMLNASIRENISLPSLKNLSGKFAFLDPGRINSLAFKTAGSFDIKAENTGDFVKCLSGGNKQKVNLSRWLVKDLSFVVLDCPTRGVDIGVKAYIYKKIMEEAKEKGLGVLLITDELQEAIGMADRIVILRRGGVAGILNRDTDFTQKKIIEVML